MEGERIVRLLAEVISAKGFERDSYFELAKTGIDGLPKLEGTVHVNRALTLKFLPQYLFGSSELSPPPIHKEAADGILVGVLRASTPRKRFWCEAEAVDGDVLDVHAPRGAAGDVQAVQHEISR